jgi:hypothetical protein
LLQGAQTLLDHSDAPVQQFSAPARMAAQALLGRGDKPQQARGGYSIAGVLLADQPLLSVQRRLEAEFGDLVAEVDRTVHVAEGGPGVGRTAVADRLPGEIGIEHEGLLASA